MNIELWFKGLRLKLLFLAVLPILALGITSFVSYRGVSELSGSLVEAGSVRAPKINFRGDMDSSRNAVFRWLWAAWQSQDDFAQRKKALEKVSKEMKDFETAEKGYAALPRDEKSNEYFTVIEAKWAKASELIQQVVTLLEADSRASDKAAQAMMTKELRPVLEPMAAAFDGLSSHTAQQIKESLAKSQQRSSEIQTMTLAFSAGATIILFVLCILMARRLTAALDQVARMIQSSSAQVASASNQVSMSSQQLASSSSEQASAVEETSASLEEISGMVENNVRNAESGLQIVETVKATSERGNHSMKQLTLAMSEVLESNKRIEQLVRVIDEIGEKTAIIDEIVFQTKLLSFNASVEAERAGEHGRGFAVVAQEVGNLAQMSGKAALEISGIVKASIKEAQAVASENRAKVENGNRHVLETATILEEIQKNSESVLSGSRQILSASKEQSAGIKQISTAMENINQATQSSAATSEEIASAGEELSQQAQNLNVQVSELNTLINGKSTGYSSGGESVANVDAIAKGTNVVRIESRKKAETFAPAPTKVAVGQSFTPPSSGNDDWDKL